MTSFEGRNGDGVASHPAAASAYRPDIDGLRAIAVLLVFAYHADVGAVSGGFIGVDVFFVISGYLITSILLRDLDAGRFSLVGFWERRVRRIVPALALVVGVTLAAFAFVHFPNDFERLGKSVLAQAFFVQNFYFYLTSGYFAGPAETMPLLHTWSLAVEEQFYVVFPLLLVAVCRFLPSRIVLVFAILAAGSFLLSSYGVTAFPNATFYLLPTRAWELLLGALLAFAGAGSLPRWLSEALSLLGLTAIIAAALLYDAETTFPGAAALPPCLGTAAIIWCNRQRLTLVSAMLAWRPCVFLGLLSYSFYLWHWPLLSFARYVALDDISTAQVAGVLALSLAAAWASWRFVERPFRERRVFAPRRRLLAASLTAGGLFAGLGLAADLSEGFPARLSAQVIALAAAAGEENPRRHECHSIEPEKIAKGELCLIGTPPRGEVPVIVSWGDSHADAVMPLLEAMAKEYSVPVWHASYSSCMPLLGSLYAERPNHRCPDFNAAMYETLSRHAREVKHVLLTSWWSIHVEGLDNGKLFWLVSDSEATARDVETAREVFRRRIKVTVKRLQALGISVWILGEVPQQTFLVPNHLAKLALLDAEISRVGRPFAEYEARNRFIASVFEELEAEGAHILDPSRFLCDDSVCHAALDGRSLYRDTHHLSVYGALQLKPLLGPLFSAAAAKLDSQ